MDDSSQLPGDHFYRTLVQSMPAALAAFDALGIQTFVNATFCSMVGWTEAELIGQSPPYRYLLPEDAAEFLRRLPLQQPLADASPDGFVVHFVNKNGDRFLVNVRATALHAPDGSWSGWTTTIEDIRQSAELNSLLQEREHFIESVTHAIPEILYVYDLQENRNVYVNRHVAEALGYSPEQIQAMGRDFLPTLLHPDDLARLPELFGRWETARDGQIMETEYRMLAADGEYRCFLARDTVFQRDGDGRVSKFIGAAQDITTRKEAEGARQQAENHLRESERRYRLLVDHSTDMIARHSPDGIYRDVTPGCMRVLGYTPHELIGRSGYEIIHPGDRDSTFHLHLQLIGEKAPKVFLLRFRRKDGDYIWVEISAQPILDPDSGEVTEILAISRDVSDRQMVQEALQQSEALFRALVEKSSDGIAMIDIDGTLRYISPTGAHLLGYEPQELHGIKVGDLIVADDRETVSRLGSEPLEPSGGSDSTAIRARTRDGSIRHLECVVTNHADDPAINGYIVNFRDISDRVALEAQLRQAQKMEAVGQLAGGIAHDFNNILTAIIGNVALLADEVEAGDPRAATLAAIDRAARRAAELTSRLLGYARRTTLHVRPCQLNRIISDCVALLQPTFDPRIVFDLQLDPECWPVLADADQLSQVVTNLCLNSRDAMPRGGRLTLATTNFRVTAEYARTHSISQAGDYVQMTVADTGIGMTQEVSARVFEPFFTTKPLGTGTGLGLAMVYGIMKSHGGEIVCHSEPSVGTRMELLVPRSQQLIDEKPEESPALESPRTAEGGATVLLVDDEPAIRMLGRQVLEQNGYRVLLAEDGIDAIETFREVSDQVALIILDLTMPRLSGHDAFKLLREINPQVRVLFSSGYAADHLCNLDDATAFISKPYRPSELLAAVRAHLSARPTGQSRASD